jgi:hypothetical protein
MGKSIETKESSGCQGQEIGSIVCVWGGGEGTEGTVTNEHRF